LNYFLNFEADPNGYFNKYREVTLLMQSILDAKRCIANMLINAGSNINLSDSEGNTALHFAYKISDSKMILNIY
jgi:ankyrin repeat protein